MNNEEKILEVLSTLQKDMSGLKEDMSVLKKDVATIKVDLTELKEEHTITRDGVNGLLEWAEDVACVVKVPIAKPKS